MFAFKFEVSAKKCPYLGEVGKFNRTVWLIYPRHCTPISIKIGQHLLKLCTKVFWCFLCPTVYKNSRGRIYQSGPQAYNFVGGVC